MVGLVEVLLPTEVMTVPPVTLMMWFRLDAGPWAQHWPMALPWYAAMALTKPPLM